MKRKRLWGLGLGDRAVRQLWALRPLRVVALAQAYGWAGLWAHGFARRRPNDRETLQIWQGPPLEPQVDYPPQTAPMEAADVQAIAQDLRPFKRGIDGLVQQLRARPGQVVAVGALDAAQLTGLALATQQAQGQWLVHDVFVFPDARRRGIGRSLIHALGARLRQIQGAELALVMTAEILPYNRASQAIFRQCGWRQVGVVSRQRPGQGPTL